MNFPKEGQRVTHFKYCNQCGRKTEHETFIRRVIRHLGRVFVKITSTCKGCERRISKTIEHKSPNNG